MVTLARTWLSSLNNPISDNIADTPLSMYQKGFFELHRWLITAGWTVEASSDSGTAGVGDNILASTDVIVGAAATPHSWARYSAPIGWASVGAGTAEIVLDALDGTPLTPAHMRMTVGTVAFSLAAGGTDGTASARPTSLKEAEHAQFAFTPNFFGTTAVTTHMHLGRSTRGDIWMAWSLTGSLVGSETGIIIAAVDETLIPATGGPDSADFAWATFYENTEQAGNPAWRTVNLMSGGNWIIPAFNGDIVSSGAITYSPVEFMTTWENGISSASLKPHHSSIELALNGVSTRYLGKLVDLRALPELLGSNKVEDNDPDPIRYVSIDGLFVPVERAQLPLII